MAGAGAGRQFFVTTGPENQRAAGGTRHAPVELVQFVRFGRGARQHAQRRRHARRHGAGRAAAALNQRQHQEEGFDFRIAGEIAKRLDVAKVQIVEADYEKLPELVRDGKVDLLMGGYVPDASIKGVEWSQGYLDFGLCMIVAEGNAWQITQPADLSGKTVAIYGDPAAGRWVKANIPNVTIRKFSGDDGWFEAVEKGQAAALIYDYPFAAAEIKEHPRTVIVKHNLNASSTPSACGQNYDRSTK